jgi:hypothetical protein
MIGPQPEDITEAVKGAGEIAKLTRDVYNDLAAPAIRELGLTAEQIARTLLRPVRGAFAGIEQIEIWAAGAVRDRFERRRVRVEDVRPPDPQIYASTVFGLRDVCESACVGDGPRYRGPSSPIVRGSYSPAVTRRGPARRLDRASRGIPLERWPTREPHEGPQGVVRLGFVFHRRPDGGHGSPRDVTAVPRESPTARPHGNHESNASPDRQGRTVQGDRDICEYDLAWHRGNGPLLQLRFRVRGRSRRRRRPSVRRFVSTTTVTPLHPAPWPGADDSRRHSRNLMVRRAGVEVEQLGVRAPVTFCVLPGVRDA